MASLPANSKPFARAGLLLVGLMFVLPFLQPYHRYPLPSFYGEWLAVVLGLMALAPLLRRGSWDGLQVPVMTLGVIALIAVVWLQFALGMMPYVGQALAPSMYLLWAALLMMVGHLLKRELGQEAVTTSLAWFLLAGGVLSAAAGILQHYQFEPLLGGLVTTKRTARVFGNLAQANHFAAYSSLSLISLVYLIGRGKFPNHYLAALVGAPVLFAAALSGSRSIWIYIVVMLIASLGLYLRDRRQEHRRLILYCAVLLPALAAASSVASLSWLTPPTGAIETTVDRMFTTVDGLGTRIGLWREAWWMFEHSPVLGVGFGQYAGHHFDYLALFGPRPEIGLTNHAHNIMFHLLAETGLLGILLVVVMVVVWLVGLSRVRASTELWWLLAVLAVIGVHSGFDFPLWYTFFLGVTAVAFGIGSTQVMRLDLVRIGPVIVALLILAGLAHSALLLRDFRRFELLVFTPYRASFEIPPAGKFMEVLPALHREPLLAPHVEIVLAMIVKLDEDKLREKLEMTTRAMRYAPVAYLVYRQAMLLALAGEREAALAQLERSLRVYPGEAREIATQLEALARDRPEAFTPLLELALARSAEIRARAATQ